jgi:hypothetical protein
MTEAEKALVKILAQLKDQNAKAVLLQNFISEEGPLSEQAGILVRKQLAK